MNLDAFTISALVDEFLDTLVGGRVQDSVSVDDTAIGLEIYANHQRRYLYLSADPQTPRVHVVPEKLRRGLERPTQLGLMVRSKVEGGLIAHVSQPPWERVIQIDFETAEGELSLIIEPMERRSNILLVQNGTILDCMRRVGPDENRYRVSLPGQPYVPPPPQVGKVDPSDLTAEFLHEIFAQNDDPKRKAQQLLSTRINGLSPLLGKEVLHRAGLPIDIRASDVQQIDALYRAIRETTAPLLKREWQPGVVESERGVSAYSVYPITFLEGWRSVDSVSAAMTLFYSAPIGIDAYKAGKEPVAEQIREAQVKLRARLASLQRSMTDEQEREVLRQSGELILAYQFAIQPSQTELRAVYDADQPELVIALDPSLTALENAQRYFDRYNRAKRALDDVPSLIRDTDQELQQLDQLAVDLDLASNWPDIDEVQQALQAMGHWRGQPKGRVPGGQKSAPLRVVTPDGFVIWVGRNSRQNEQVTFDKGSPLDLWLHARGVPGSHVIIKLDGRTAPEHVIEQAASLAAYYSAKRADGKVVVDVAPRRHVRKIKGGGPGQVTYRNEETRTVTPRSEKDLLT